MYRRIKNQISNPLLEVLFCFVACVLLGCIILFSHLQSLAQLPYDKWHEYDAEDSFRYYALRLHEMGFVKSSPQKIIADGTDWRFLNELKREIKA